jgi:hypothetical protein
MYRKPEKQAAYEALRKQAARLSDDAVWVLGGKTAKKILTRQAKSLGLSPQDVRDVVAKVMRVERGRRKQAQLQRKQAAGR